MLRNIAFDRQSLKIFPSWNPYIVQIRVICMEKGLAQLSGNNLILLVRVFTAISATTNQLDPCPSWLVKASRTVTRSWVQARMRPTSHCRRAHSQPLLRGIWFALSLNKHHWIPPVWTISVQSIYKMKFLQFWKILDETDSFQSVFRHNYGIEAALVALVDDQWQGKDDHVHLSLLSLTSQQPSIPSTINFWVSCGICGWLAVLC